MRKAIRRTDLVLAWIAIFLWTRQFTQEYTSMDGIINVVIKLSSGQPISFVRENTPILIGFGVGYWIAFLGLLFVGIIFVITFIQTMVLPRLPKKLRHKEKPQIVKDSAEIVAKMDEISKRHEKVANELKASNNLSLILVSEIRALIEELKRRNNIKS